ncbi:hypothetical protein AVEN_166005-1 [Araneus ventricosus]|uniref:Uncharacterized protein n=1 Tax=Araneus ventricosus TaxID=182803 RepID=A0A4Y2TH51_ARAVE|nr:hypothetical protein AVEN_166005-1 [Araneus ventricosus]
MAEHSPLFHSAFSGTWEENLSSMKSRHSPFCTPRFLEQGKGKPFVNVKLSIHRCSTQRFLEHGKGKPFVNEKLSIHRCSTPRFLEHGKEKPFVNEKLEEHSTAVPSAFSGTWEGKPFVNES